MGGKTNYVISIVRIEGSRDKFWIKREEENYKESNCVNYGGFIPIIGERE